MDNLPAKHTGMHPLDTDEAQDRLKNLQGYRHQARIAQAPNRDEMAIDEDFYDGIQLRDEDITALDSRGQDPLVFNLTKNTVNWVLGTERKSRIDFSVKPRRKQDIQEAKTKTKGIKYIQDLNHGEYVRSEAFADAVRAGIGWVEIGAREQDDPVYYSKENWRYMWFDHLGGDDINTWRYVLREKWTDLDIALAMFPDREEALEVLATGVNSLYPYISDDSETPDDASEFDLENDAFLGGAYDGLRERVKLCEMWYRTPAQVKVLKLNDHGTPYGTRHGIIYRPEDDEHKYLVKGKYASLMDQRKMTTRVGLWAGSTFLYDTLSPYDHDLFPFFPIFCYRRKRDGMPYGIIRDIRDPQSDMNKRKSKSLFMLSAHRVIIEEGAVNDPATFRAEMDRPDGCAVVRNGALSAGKIHVVNEQALAVAHLELARDDAKFIQDIAGITDENLGKRSNATSGKAIEARQLQGQTTSGIVFDNFYHSFQMQGECLLRLIEQYWDAEKEFRITGDERQDEFVAVNQMDENGQLTNSMTRHPADFIVSKQDFRETIRIAMGEMIMDLIKSLIQGGMHEVALALLDMAVDMMDELPGKDEVVARIRKINGQEGPDEGMSPQEKQKRQAEMEQRQAEQQKQSMLKEKMIELEIRLKTAEITAKEAEASGKQAKAALDTVAAAAVKIESFMKALETAGAIHIAPQLVGAADTLIDEAGQAIGGRQMQAAPAPVEQQATPVPEQQVPPDQQQMIPGGMQ